MGSSLAAHERTPDRELAAFVAGLSPADVPEVALRAAERAFVDTVGVTLAGAAEGAGATAIEAVDALSGDGSTPVFGTDRRLSPADAAFVNATAGHGLDFDDVTWGVWHPSVPMVAPALIAAAERGVGGDRVAAGFVAGYETQVYLASALLPAHYERGWHATSTLGTFGAAAAVATVLDLDESAARHALNAAASMPAGLKHNFGSMTKPMHAGHAARAGFTAATLADHGFTAADGAVGAERGFCDLYSGDADPALDELPRLGERWALLEDGIQVKKFPCCNFTHPAIAAALELRETHDLSGEDVASVHVSASQGAADALHHADPDTGLEAKFSMEYPVAAALSTGRVDLATFDDANVDDPAVQAVRERVTFEVDPDLPYNPFETTVAVETTGGDRHERLREKPPGMPDDPLSDAELREKFELCAARAPAAVDADAVHDALDALRERDAADVLATLS
jgi:2-methylcitrate dehydratase PrpD